MVFAPLARDPGLIQTAWDAGSVEGESAEPAPPWRHPAAPHPTPRGESRPVVALIPSVLSE